MKKGSNSTVPGRFTTVEINEEVCTGCNTCVDICIMDVLAPAPKKGEPPIVAYPEECWFDGCCVDVCPKGDKGAIRITIPQPMRVSAVRKKKSSGSAPGQKAKEKR